MKKKALFKMKSEKCLIKSDFKNEYLIINSQYWCMKSDKILKKIALLKMNIKKWWIKSDFENQYLRWIFESDE